MEYLGGQNFLFSEYIIGTAPPINLDIQDISTLHKWLKFKDEDWAMEQYNTDNTQYVAILHIIKLEFIEEIINDLARIYKKSYPYSEKKDFLEHVFAYTIFDLKEFTNKNNYYTYGVDIQLELEFYFRYSKSDGEYIDYGIDPTKDIEYYKQYYKKVLFLIENFDFDKIGNTLIDRPENSKQTDLIINIDTKKSVLEKDELKESIDLYLDEFKINFSDSDYTLLSNALYEYFSTGEFPSIGKTIKVLHQPNIKAVGWMLKELYQREKLEPLSKATSYFLFFKNHLSIFNKIDFDIDNPTKSQLYKYFTQKPYK